MTDISDFLPRRDPFGTIPSYLNLGGINKPDRCNPVLLFPATELPACLSAIMSGRRSVVVNPFSLFYAAAEIGFRVIAA
ncbi:MAG: hypothetical protein L6422_07705 [Candidatus Marinimicrobia bacterium]|nr:hypothetical protein [Candidatus Neomarinimicrobiota bacterium]